MAKSNFSFEKRQKELARKKKKDDKQKRKHEKGLTPPEENTDLSHQDATPEIDK